MVLDRALAAPLTKIIVSIPASSASSTAYWINGRSTMGSNSFGTALVAGRKRVPMPATGNTALRIFWDAMREIYSETDSLFARQARTKMVEFLCHAEIASKIDGNAFSFPVAIAGGG
jgi:hypothetical protein